MATSTALLLTGRDVLPLLHRTTSNALADLPPGGARATLFCDFRGRLLHRAVVAVASDGAVWLLRADAPGEPLAAAIDRMVFRDDVHVEDRSAAHPVTWLAGEPEVARVLAESDGAPALVACGDGTRYSLAGGDALGEAERIARLLPRHGHEIAEAFNPFEVGLAREVHLAKGCFTGQEALQRLVTYESVRRRPARVRLAVEAAGVPRDVLAAGTPAGVLTSIAGRDGFAVLRREALEAGAPLALDDGTPVEILSAPEPSRPLGRP